MNYYHRFIPHIAGILAPLHAQASGKGQTVQWSEACQTAFEKAKEALKKAVLLHHTHIDAPASLTVDASNSALVAQLEQKQVHSWVPLAFFSRKLSQADQKYGVFDRELLATYSAIKHFRHFLERRSSTLCTDHKPLMSALRSRTERSPRQTRHLSCIALFTTDIQYITDKFSVVADDFSRFSINSNSEEQNCFCVGSFSQLAQDQVQSGEMYSSRTATTGLKLQDIQFGTPTVQSDTSTGVTRPVLPTSWTRPIFFLSNPKTLTYRCTPTQQVITQRFV